MRNETKEAFEYWYKLLVVYAGVGAFIAMIVFGANVLTVGGLIVLLFLWLIGPNQLGEESWATPVAAKTKLAFRPFFIAIFVICGLLLGLSQPLEIVGLPESLHRPATAVLYAAGGGVFGRVVCWLRPITGP